MTLIFFFFAESHDYDYDIAKVVSTMDSPTNYYISCEKYLVPNITRLGVVVCNVLSIKIFFDFLKYMREKA